MVSHSPNGEFGRLCVSFNYEDEWTSRVGEFIVNLSSVVRGPSRSC